MGTNLRAASADDSFQRNRLLSTANTVGNSDQSLAPPARHPSQGPGVGQGGGGVIGRSVGAFVGASDGRLDGGPVCAGADDGVLVGATVCPDGRDVGGCDTPSVDAVARVAVASVVSFRVESGA